MEILTYSGFLFIIISGCFSGIFSTFFNKNKKWAWENNWLVWSVMALIVCPFIAVYFTIPDVLTVYANHPSTTGIIAALGIAWGIGALLFGKGIDSLGISLAIPIMQGLINSIGTLVPYLMNYDSTASPSYNIPIGVLVILLGIIIFSNAGKEKEKDTKRTSNFTKGLIICILAGILGPMINFAFVLGEPLQETAIKLGTEKLFSANATWAIIFITAFIVNMLQCFYLLKKNKTIGLYKQSSIINYVWAAIAGIVWYGSIFLYGIGCNYIGDNAASIGWAMMQTISIIAGNVAGIMMGEWKGASRASWTKMLIGMFFLILGVLIISMN